MSVRNCFQVYIGGDEFAAVINCGEPNRIEEFKAQFKNALDEASTRIVRFKLEASIGICNFNEEQAATLSKCVEIADRRMYEDKRARKNCRK